MTPTTTTRMRPNIANHQLLTKFETLSSIRVGSGSLALKDLKNTTNFGITNVARMTTTMIAMTEDDHRVDHRRRYFPPRFDLPFQVVRQLVEHHVEVPRQFGR